MGATARSTVVPGVMLLAAGALLALATELPMGAFGTDGRGASTVVWMTHVSGVSEPVGWVLALAWGTALALAAAGAVLVLTRTTWVRWVVRCLLLLPILVQAVAITRWWALWSEVADRAAGALGIGFVAATASLVLAVSAAVVPGRRVAADPEGLGTPPVVNPAAMGDAPAGWYDVAGGRHHWDGTDWTTYVTGR